MAERFLADLSEAVEHVKAHSGAARGMAPVYGLAATMPVRGLVHEMLGKYLDKLYEP